MWITEIQELFEYFCDSFLRPRTPIYFLFIASIFIEEIIFWSIKEFQISKFQKGWNKSILPKHVDGRLEISYFWKKILKDHSAFIWRNHTGYKVNTSESVSHSDAIIMS